MYSIVLDGMVFSSANLLSGGSRPRPRRRRHRPSCGSSTLGCMHALSPNVTITVFTITVTVTVVMVTVIVFGEHASRQQHRVEAEVSADHGVLQAGS